MIKWLLCIKLVKSVGCEPLNFFRLCQTNFDILLRSENKVRKNVLANYDLVLFVYKFLVFCNKSNKRSKRLLGSLITKIKPNN